MPVNGKDLGIQTAENFVAKNESFREVNVELAKKFSEKLFAVNADKDNVDKTAEHIKKVLFPENISNEDREAQVKMLGETTWLAIHMSNNEELISKMNSGLMSDVLPKALRKIGLEEQMEKYQKAFNAANEAKKEPVEESTDDSGNIGDLMDAIKNKGAGSDEQDLVEEGKVVWENSNGEKENNWQVSKIATDGRVIITREDGGETEEKRIPKDKFEKSNPGYLEKHKDIPKEGTRKKEKEHEGKKVVIIGKDGKKEEGYYIADSIYGEPVVDRLVNGEWKAERLDYKDYDRDKNTFTLKKEDKKAKEEDIEGRKKITPWRGWIKKQRKGLEV